MEKTDHTLTGDALVATMRKSANNIKADLDSMFDNRRKALTVKREELEQEREVARQAAADGDASENAPLQTAYENISRLTIEIMAMESSVDSYERVAGDADSDAQPGGVCSVGSVVCIADVTRGEPAPTWIIKLYPAGLGNAKVGAIAIDTPLGIALLSHSKGECVQCAAPAGTITYLIKEVI